MATNYKPLNYRIVRHVTAKRILTVEDNLEMGKIKVGLVDYHRGHGITAQVTHWLDVDKARLLFHDLVDNAVAFKNMWDGWTDYKGSAVEGDLESRIFTVQIVEAKNPVKITASKGPGEKVGQGAVKPVKGTDRTEVAVLLSWQDARAIALAVDSHLQAWAAATYYKRLAEATWQPEDGRRTAQVDLDTGEVL